MPRRRDEPPEPWWVQRWLALLDIYGDEYRTRLAKGRGYFNDGRIFEIAVQPGRVSARARGSYGESYRVHLDVPPLPDDAWRRVAAALAARADYVALLLGGELPAALEGIFAEAGAALFPEPGTPTGDCTCYDWSNPCKHVFGLYYGFATLLRAEPSLLFELRGRGREDLLRVVQRAWSGTSEPAPAAPTPAPDAPPSLTAPLRVERFFTASGALDALDTPITPLPADSDGVLIRRLGRPPFARETEDVLTPIGHAYAAVSRRALMSLRRSAAKSLLREG